MDIVWTALVICILVGLVFYLLAQYWHRLLRIHSRALRELTERVQALEEMEDPSFRQKVGDSVPSPLEQVYTFTFRLGERFWTETLAASPEEIAYIKANGKFLGSVKIERWRSHSVVTVYEVLPQSSSAGWQSRSIDVYPGAGEPATLWELPLSAPVGDRSAEAAPNLELRFGENVLSLSAQHGRFGALQGNGSGMHHEGAVYFHVPLDTARLAVYRKQSGDDPAGDSSDARPATRSSNSWLSFFEHHDESLGVDWRLTIRDLERKEDWDRWKSWGSWDVRRREVE